MGHEWPSPFVVTNGTYQLCFLSFFFHSVFITSCETEEKKCDSFHQTTFSRTRVTTYTFYRCLSTYVVSMFQKLLQLFILVCVCFFLLFHSFSHSLFIHFNRPERYAFDCHIQIDTSLIIKWIFKGNEIK